MTNVEIEVLTDVMIIHLEKVQRKQCLRRKTVSLSFWVRKAIEF